jgi:hypothetical protein
LIRWVIVLILLLLPSAVGAFDLGPVGVSGGGSWVTQKFEFKEGYDFLDPVDGGIVGPVVGAFMRAQLGEGVAVGLEMLYLQKGIKWTYIETNVQGEQVGERTDTYKAHYLSIPAIVRLETTTKKTNLFLFGGLSVDVPISHDEFYSSLSSVTLAVQAGFGLDWGRWELSVRYLGDLTNAIDPGPDWNLQSVKSRGVIALVAFEIWPSDRGSIA